MKRKWGYDDVMDYAKKERDSVPSVPWIKFNQEFLDAEKDVDWADVSSASNQQLQKLLTIYGGGKAILEHVVATLRAKVGAVSAIFDEEYNAMHNPPTTLEQKYYRDIFNEKFPGHSNVIPYFWMPKFVEATDASARTLNVYKTKQKTPFRK